MAARFGAAMWDSRGEMPLWARRVMSKAGSVACAAKCQYVPPSDCQNHQPGLRGDRHCCRRTMVKPEAGFTQLHGRCTALSLTSALTGAVRHDNETLRIFLKRNGAAIDPTAP